MKSRTFALGALTAVFAGFLLTGAVASADLPPLPDPSGAPSTNASASGRPSGPNVLLERARRGIVTIERDGRPLGVGTVLSGDGRVLTSLAALGQGEQADVRYADGTTAHVRVGHRDPVWDLALLVPQSGHWTEGLMASETDPATARQLAAFVPTQAAPAPIPAPFKDRIEARSKAGDLLVDALEFDTRTPPGLGTPIVDASGSVVAVIVRACRDHTEGGAVVGPCSAITIGAPVAALRRFLLSTPTTAIAPQPWLGIRGEPDASGSVRGVRVLAVAPGSPADKSGLKATAEKAQGDLIVAVDSQPVDTPEKLAAFISKHSIGDSVKLLVFGGDRFREVNVILRAAQLQ